jgi:hypothetical protein
MEARDLPLVDYSTSVREQITDYRLAIFGPYATMGVLPGVCIPVLG